MWKFKSALISEHPGRWQTVGRIVDYPSLWYSADRVKARRVLDE
jgi:hypothetical protein